jgi:hypothetical protein
MWLSHLEPVDEDRTRQLCVLVYSLDMHLEPSGGAPAVIQVLNNPLANVVLTADVLDRHALAPSKSYGSQGCLSSG